MEAWTEPLAALLSALAVALLAERRARVAARTARLERAAHEKKVTAVVKKHTWEDGLDDALLEGEPGEWEEDYRG